MCYIPLETPLPDECHSLSAKKPPAGESSAGGSLYVLTLHEGLIYYG